jgi:Protease inhibitor Inh
MRSLLMRVFAPVVLAPISLAPAVFALGFAVTGALPALAQQTSGPYPHDHASVKLVAGAWDISNAKGRKCRLQLNNRAPSGKLLVLGVPTPCKATFPPLTTTTQWELLREGIVVFKATDGTEVLRFARAGSGPLKAKVGAEDFQIEPIPGRYPSSEQQQSILQATSPPQAAAPVARLGAAPQVGAAAATIIAAPAADKITGQHALMRVAGREACRIELSDRPAKRGGEKEAMLAKNCADQGLKTFDPIGWRVDQNKLLLMARKGHSTSFAYGSDAIWRKDPPTGALLMLQKLP